MNEKELYHYGILGQKWGVRRYQNADGSYTNAGKRRYGMNLDLNDKSRKNVAKIRLGEAKRRLDVAKSNNSTNKTRHADLQVRVRSAKRAVRNADKVDRGAKLAAKGKTITGVSNRTFLVNLSTYLAYRMMPRFLNMRLSQLRSQGRYKPSTLAAAQFINDNSAYLALGVMGINTLIGKMNESDLRAYNVARAQGETSLKRTGSEEYSDVIERNKKK